MYLEYDYVQLQNTKTKTLGRVRFVLRKSLPKSVSPSIVLHLIVGVNLTTKGESGLSRESEIVPHREVATIDFQKIGPKIKGIYVPIKLFCLLF